MGRWLHFGSLKIPRLKQYYRAENKVRKTPIYWLTGKLFPDAKSRQFAAGHQARFRILYLRDWGTPTF